MNRVGRELTVAGCGGCDWGTGTGHNVGDDEAGVCTDEHRWAGAAKSLVPGQGTASDLEHMDVDVKALVTKLLM